MKLGIANAIHLTLAFQAADVLVNFHYLRLSGAAQIAQQDTVGCKLAKDDRHGWVFPNADGNAYTAQSFKLGFNRLKKSAAKAGKLSVNFTFHDLRSYYVTQFKARYGALPEIHADPGTTARIYDSSKIVNRKTL